MAYSVADVKRNLRAGQTKQIQANSAMDPKKHKLMMRGQKIDKGGRTASGYIVRKLTEALERLSAIETAA